MIRALLLIITAGLLLSTGSAEARDITKKEAVEQLSATEVVRKKVAELLDFKIGYDFTKISRVSMAPVIKYVRAVPIKAPPDNRTIVSVIAEVDDPGGRRNINRVQANLSELGKPAEVNLVDNGLWGDVKAGDGIYTLQTVIARKAKRGELRITIEVSNKGGWRTVDQANIIVHKEPAILQAMAKPWEVGRGNYSVLTVQIDNPGGIGEIEKVVADLSSIGSSASAFLRNDGKSGDSKAEDDIFSLEVLVGANIAAGRKVIPVEVVNVVGGKASGTILLKVR